jgi:formylglycine-generating enzyme
MDAAADTTASSGTSSSSSSSGGDTAAGADSGQGDGGAGADSGQADTGAGADSGQVDSGIVAMQSCAPGGPGMTNCGPGGSGSESCCTSLEVSGGTYDRTYNTGASLTGPPDGGWPDLADPATVSSFSLDKYLVTVGRFRQFVNTVVLPDGNVDWFPPTGSGKQTYLNGGQGLVNVGSPDGGSPYETGWDAAWSSTNYFAPTDANLTSSSCSPYATWTSSPDGGGAGENLPINCINWYEAYAFCIWDGGFLASEAQWEYAAAGGSQQRLFPWGSVAPAYACPGDGCDYAIYDCDYPNGTLTCSGVDNFAPVGTAVAGAGFYGQLDMAGEVWEWTLDWYQSSYVDPCTDCANLSSASQRELRGGGYYAYAGSLLAVNRVNHGAPLAPTTRSAGSGFRCARVP